MNSLDSTSDGPTVGGSLVVRGLQVVDGTGGPPRRGTVRVMGGLVQRVEAEDGGPPPGATVLPGLIDVHTHLTLPGDGASYETMARVSDLRMVAQAVRNCAVHLAAGVTTLRDNGSRGPTAIAVRDAANDGLFPAPRILASGPPVTPTGGHFAWCGGAADGVDGVRAAVRGLLARGADFVKVMASGGGTAGSRPDRAGFGQAEMRTIVESAHDLGLLTTAHCRATEGIERAVAAGIDCIEHAEFLHPSGEARFDPAVAEAIAASPSFVSPTMQAFGHYRLQLLARDQSQRALTQAEQAMQDRLQRHLDNHLRIMELLVPLVGPERFVYGSDAGPGFTAFGEVRWGLELMIRSGMTARQALHSVTGVAARAIGLGGSVGELRDGQRADLLLVRGDPDQDVRAIGDVIGVIQNGRPVHIADAATFWEHVQLIDQEEG